MSTLDKRKVTVEEMKEFFKANSPFEPTNPRIGKFAKSMGYQYVQQMVKGKINRFYIKTELFAVSEEDFK